MQSVSLSLSEELFRQVRAAADAEGQDVTEWIAGAMLEALHRRSLAPVRTEFATEEALTVRRTDGL